MTLPLMVYGTVVACLLAAATFFLDRSLRAMGRPSRWAWALGMTSAVIVPLFSRRFRLGNSGLLPVESRFLLSSSTRSWPAEVRENRDIPTFSRASMDHSSSSG